MRLIRLTANQPSFRSVTFNRTGLSIVTAEQRSQAAGSTRTYNGVGKTLMLELIQYCLGSNKKKAFEKHLNGWIFGLEIEIEGTSYLIERAAAVSDEIRLNGSQITLQKLKDLLSDSVFDQRARPTAISFRSIVPHFLRSTRSSYLEFQIAAEGEAKKPYEAMLRSAFLLGLDLELAVRKFELRRKELTLRNTMSQLESDPIFSTLISNKTVEIELGALKEQSARLLDDLNRFEVAEDYHDIQMEADRIKRGLDLRRREMAKVNEALAQIERSAVAPADLDPDRVFQLYEEARAILPLALKRTVEEVLQFQSDLARRRAERLAKETRRLKNELKRLHDATAEGARELDEKLRYLGAHRALDEYVAVSNERALIEKQIASLEESNALRARVERELQSIELEYAESNIATSEYLEMVRAHTEEASVLFRDFARELYGARASGLTFSNDPGRNQLRYRIDAHIAGDAAEGINEAKIFCFDMVILSLRRNHRFQFVAHDSTLFSPVDPRQRLGMLRIADRVARQFGTQYIATLNLHDVTSIHQQLPELREEVDRLVGEQTIVLRLTDESPESRLLGIDVDMDYKN